MAPTSNPYLLLLLLLPLLLLPFATPDEAAEKAALLRLKQAVGISTDRLPWNQSIPLCSLRGVTCADGTVVELRLPGKKLRGTIPSGIFGNLTSLRALSLRNNAITGPLPSDLSSCTQLQELRLENTHLSGDFPAVILSLTSLTNLSLAGSNLSGPIPAGLTNLKNLAVLLLDDNRFSGELPDLQLPALVQFNVSYNLLHGPVPAGLRGMPADAFLGTSLCGGPLPPCPDGGVKEAEKTGRKKALSTGAIIAIVVCSTIAVLAVVAVVFLLCRERRGSKAVRVEPTVAEMGQVVPREAGQEAPGEVKVVPPQPSPPPPRLPPPGERKTLVFLGNRRVGTFELEELLRASAEVLGKGTFGTTYKAALDNGIVVATKRLKAVEVAAEEFRARVEAIGALHHPNVVGVEAYHYSRDEKLLLYKYMPMGSLSSSNFDFFDLFMSSASKLEFTSVWIRLLAG